MTLYTGLKEVEDALVQRLVDTAISDVLGIVYNKEIKWGDIKNPYIRIFPEPFPVNDIAVMTVRENWSFTYTIMAVAQTYESAEADQTRRIALDVASAMFWDPINLVADRCLRIGGVPNVSDIERTVFHTDYERELPTDKLFGSAIEVVARKILMEV